MMLKEVDDQFGLVFGYLVDIENHTAMFRELAPGASWIDTTLEEVTSPTGIVELFKQRGMPSPANIKVVVAAAVNQRTVEKSAVGQLVSEDWVRQRLQEFLRRHEGRPDLERFVTAHALEW